MWICTPLFFPTMLISSFIYNLKHTHCCQHWLGEGGRGSVGSPVNTGQERGRGLEKSGILSCTNKLIQSARARYDFVSVPRIVGYNYRLSFATKALYKWTYSKFIPRVSLLPVSWSKKRDPGNKIGPVVIQPWVSYLARTKPKILGQWIVIYCWVIYFVKNCILGEVVCLYYLGCN